MIRNLRRRFIATAMLAVMLVLILILGTLVIENFKLVNDRADNLLETLAEFGGEFPDDFRDLNNGKLDRNNASDSQTDDSYSDPIEDPKYNGIGWNDSSKITGETPYDTRYFSVTLHEDGDLALVNTTHINMVDSDLAVEMADLVRDTGKEKGYLNGYRYLVVSNDDGSDQYLFLERSKELASAQNLTIVTMMVYILANLLIFILIVLFSRKVFEPVQESYSKQKEFITNAGHELKTPLAIIDSCTEVIEMEQGENKWTEGIHEQVQRLTTMTKELVDLSRMDETDTDLEKTVFDFSKAAKEVLDPFTLMAEEHGLTLNLYIEPNIEFYGSERTLKQLCSIFADNAIKYATPNSTIKIALKRVRGKKVQLSSYNEAEGLTKGSHNELFSRFYRGDTSHNSQTSGYGIGLSMARSIVDSHGGKITAESEDGKSFRIKAVLPDKKPARSN